jgi:hypothetical protein
MTPQRKRLQKIYFRIEKIASGGKENYYDYINLIDELVEKGDYSNLEQVFFTFYTIDIQKFRSLTEVKSETWKNILFQTKNPFSVKLKKVFDDNKVYQLGYEFWNNSDNTLNFNFSGPLNGDYVTVSSTQSLSLTNQSGQFYISSNDTNIYQYEIFKCEWKVTGGLDTPVLNTIETFQTIDSGTQSSYKTEISTNHGRDYLVVTRRRNSSISNSFKTYNWKLSVRINDFLGEIKERVEYSDESKYLSKNAEFARIIGARVTYLDVVRGTYSTVVDYTNPNWTEEQNLIQRYKLAIEFLKS